MSVLYRRGIRKESVCILRSIYADFNVSESCDLCEHSIRIAGRQDSRRAKFTYCNIYYETIINILLHYMNLD